MSFDPALCNIFVRGPKGVEESLESALPQIVGKAVYLTDSLPLSLYEKDCILLWVTNPSEASCEKTLLASLRTVEHIEIVSGGQEEIVSWFKERFREEEAESPEETQTGIGLDFSETTNSFMPIVSDTVGVPATENSLTPCFLIAPPGHYDEFVDVLRARGFSCGLGQIPLDRAQVEQAEKVFVWIPNEDAGRYERVALLVEEKMKKQVSQIRQSQWREDLALHFGETARTQSPQEVQKKLVQTRSSAVKARRVVSEEELQQSIKSYIFLLKEFVSYNLQRLPYEQDVETDSPLESLIGQIRRWSRMVLSYRKGPDQFKPWKTRPCPEGVSSSIWNILQQATLAQSKFVLKVLVAREACLENVSETEFIQKQTSQWTGVEKFARDYLVRRRFEQVFKSLIDKEDFPQKEDGEEEGGIFKGLFRSKRDKNYEEIEEAIRSLEDQERKAWRSVVATEFEALEKDLIERFWQFYEEVAVHWTLNEKLPQEKDHKARFLRFGFLGRDVSGLTHEHLGKLTEVVAESTPGFIYQDQEVHAIYFDEFLNLIAQQEVAPSYDEELELNDRGSPEWKAARKLRKVASLKRLHKIRSCQIKNCEDQFLDLKQQMAALSVEMKAAEQNKNRNKFKTLKDKHHQTKVKMGRFKSFIDKMKREQHDSKIPRRVVFERQFPLEFWVRKEVKHLKAKTRLMNRLKDQHFSNDLKEDLKDPSVSPTTSRLVGSHVAEILAHDVALSDHVLIPHKKRTNALIARVPPLFITAPGGGGDGVCLEPASESSEGRVLLPLFPRGPETIREFIVNALSDFRWDSSMVTAGPEWITSDTLVGAYSRCRWEYRNKDKDVREKSLIYKEETDKKNFRRHYRLFEKSADEGGKLLFYKSRIIYENLIRYFPLPEGVEKLDRS